MKPLQTFPVTPHGHAALSQQPPVLTRIYREHGEDPHRMAETLLLAGVPLPDVELLRRLPWPYLANRIGVERERLGLSAVHPLLDWKLPPPPPDWLTPTVIVQMFELALHGPGEPPPEADQTEDDEDDDFTGKTLVLPA